MVDNEQGREPPLGFGPALTRAFVLSTLRGHLWWYADA